MNFKYLKSSATTNSIYWKLQRYWGESFCGDLFSLMLRGKEEILSVSARRKGVIQLLHGHGEQGSVYRHKRAEGVY